MRYLPLFALLLPSLTYGVTLCPSKIQYANGLYLKSGDRYYYPQGSYLVSNSRIYYPNGQYLKNGSRYYYSNGNTLQKEDQLYYPNGQTLKRQDRYYYSNGVPLKSGDTFYYENGNYARRNGQLYRPNGTLSAFPVRIAFLIGNVGEFLADIHAKTETIEIAFDGDFIQSSQVDISAPWENGKFQEVRILIRTGIPQEWVLLRQKDELTQCELIPPPSRLRGLGISRNISQRTN